MKKFYFVICAVLLFSPCGLSQANQSESAVKDAAAPYQKATLVKLTAYLNTKAREVSHTTVLDATIVSEKIVTYQFKIRSEALQYTSRYTPEKQPGNLPDAWWKGNAPVEISARNGRLFIKLPEGGEVASRIISQTPAAK
jgi:hypothetical protein